MTVATAFAPKTRLTVSEYEELDSELRYELIEGELVEMAPTSEEHGGVGSNLTYILTHAVRHHKLGQCFGAETGFVIDTVRNIALAPDWAFIRAKRLSESLSEKFSRIVPDAVLEVRSPSDRPVEVRRKMELWVEAGVRLAWEYNPKTKRMTVYRPDTEPLEIGLDEIVSGEEVIPGFSMTLREMLA